MRNSFFDLIMKNVKFLPFTFSLHIENNFVTLTVKMNLDYY